MHNVTEEQSTLCTERGRQINQRNAAPRDLCGCEPVHEFSFLSHAFNVGECFPVKYVFVLFYRNNVIKDNKYTESIKSHVARIQQLDGSIVEECIKTKIEGKTRKKKLESTAPGIPRRSPIQVLTRLDVA